MTVITEAELREMWQSGRGKIAPLPSDVRLTPAAQDFIKDWGIALTFADNAPPPAADTPAAEVSGLPLNAPPPETTATAPTPQLLHRGKPVIRPPRPTPHASPRYLRGGKPFLHHPNDVVTATLSPQQKLRTAHAVLLGTIVAARRMNLPELAAALAEMAHYAQDVLVGNRTIPLKLPNHPPETIRSVLADPSGTLGIEALAPTPTDGEMVLQLNVLYAHLQETLALADPGEPVHRAVASLTRAVFYLMLLLKADKFSWQPPGFATPKSNR